MAKKVKRNSSELKELGKVVCAQTDLAAVTSETPIEEAPTVPAPEPKAPKAASRRQRQPGVLVAAGVKIVKWEDLGEDLQKKVREADALEEEALRLGDLRQDLLGEICKGLETTNTFEHPELGLLTIMRRRAGKNGQEGRWFWRPKPHSGGNTSFRMPGK